MFRIFTDPARKLINIEASGFSNVDEVELFRQELKDLLLKLRWRSGEYVCLMHTLDEVVQTQAVMQAFSDTLSSFPIPSRKIAIVKGGALASLQSRRILDGDRSALFASVTEAERWLYA